MNKITELGAIIAEIAEKTGVELATQSYGGDETYFTVETPAGPADLYLRGTGEHADALARLISYCVAESVTGQRSASDRKGELRLVLLGEGGAWRAAQYMTKYNLADADCFAVEIIPDRLSEHALTHVEGCMSEEHGLVIGMEDGRIAVVKFLDEEQSPYEFGTFLSQSLFEELGVRASVGVGCEVKSFREIAESYAQAATAVRMSTMLHGEGEVHSYREYLLVRMLEDVPRHRLEDYMEQFRIAETDIFEDEEMMETAEEFLKNSLNISETSRNLFMHRNTLAYRLDKIERATGLNIRKFSDAVTFRVITALYKLLQS